MRNPIFLAIILMLSYTKVFGQHDIIADPNQKACLGCGFDSKTGRIKTATLAYNLTDLKKGTHFLNKEDGDGEKIAGGFFKFYADKYQSEDEIYRNQELDLKVAARYLTFNGDLSGYSKATYASSQYSVCWSITAELIWGTKAIQNVPISTSAKDALKKPSEFSRLYGDEYVASQTIGQRFTYLFVYNAETSTEQKIFREKLNANWGAIASGGTINQSFLSDYSENKKADRIHVEIIAWGGIAPPPIDLMDVSNLQSKLRDYFKGLNLDNGICLGYSTEKFDMPLKNYCNEMTLNDFFKRYFLVENQINILEEYENESFWSDEIRLKIHDQINSRKDYVRALLTTARKYLDGSFDQANNDQLLISQLNTFLPNLKLPQSYVSIAPTSCWDKAIVTSKNDLKTMKTIKFFGYDVGDVVEFNCSSINVDIKSSQHGADVTLCDYGFAILDNSTQNPIYTLNGHGDCPYCGIYAANVRFSVQVPASKMMNVVLSKEYLTIARNDGRQNDDIIVNIAPLQITGQ